MFYLVVAEIKEGRRYGEILTWKLTKKKAIEMADKWENALSEKDKKNIFYEVKREKDKKTVYSTYTEIKEEIK